MKSKTPEGPLLIVKVDVEQTGFNPDAVDMQVYAINIGNTALRVRVVGESFMTIDEESGETADDATEQDFLLEPGEVRLLTEIEGWEWDGHVGMEISAGKPDDENFTIASYNFKSSAGDYFIESLKLQGRIVKAPQPKKKRKHPPR